MKSRVENCAEKINLSSCISVCNISKELYGSIVVVFDRDKASRILRSSCFGSLRNRDLVIPQKETLDNALHILEDRFVAWKERERF